MDFATLAKTARLEGARRSEYASRCTRVFNSVREELMRRAVTAGGRAQVFPEGSGMPQRGRISAQVEITFPGEPTFDADVNGMTTWFGVRVLHGIEEFELSGPGFVGIVSNAEEAVDTLFSELAAALKARTAEVNGDA